MNNDNDELAALRREVATLRQRLSEQNATDDRLPPAGSPGGNHDNVIGSFFEASVSPLVLLDQDFNYIRVNAAYANICRRDRSEFSGCNHFEFCPVHFKDTFDRVVCTKKPEKVDARPLSFPDHPEWGVTYWNWNLTPLLDKSGEVEFIVFSLEEVTRQQQAEMELRESESRFHALFENMTNGFVLYEILFDDGGKAVDALLVDVNPAWEKIIGRSKNEVIGKSLREISPWVGQDWFDIYENIVRTGMPHRVDCENIKIGMVFDAHYYIPRPGHLAVTFVDVTERAKVVEAGRTLLEELEDLYHNAPCGYHSLDKDGVVVRINDTELDWLGYSRKEVVGKKKFSDFLTPASCQIYQENFPRFKQRGYVRDLEFDVTRKDGSIMSVMISASAITDSTGNYLMSRSTVFDVTDHRKADRALQESEEQFRTAFENASIGRALTAPDGHLLKVNRAFCELVGYSEEELTSMNFATITHPDDMARSRESIRCLMSGERKTYQFDKRYIHKDGHIVFVSASTILLRDAQGDPQYLISDFMDVTERWKADQKINRLNRVYSVLTNINQMIVRVRSVDQLYEEACRIAVEDGKLRMAWVGIADEATGLVSPVASSGVVDGYLDKILVASHNTPHGRGPTGTSIRENRYVICNDFRNDSRVGPWREEAIERGYLSSAAFPLRKGNHAVGSLMLYSGESGFFDDEEIGLLLSLADDISFAIEFIEQDNLRRRAESEVRRLNNELERRVRERTKQLEAANEQLEAFAYSVSHDLRAPLRAINGFSSILAEEYLDKLDDEGRGYVTRIERNSRRMGELISGLLNLSRVTRAPLTLSHVDMETLAQQVYDEFSPLLSDRAIAFDVRKCPPIHADNALMYQVMQNLIGNAIKFTQATAEARIEFCGNVDDGEVIFCVRDNGAGFDMQRADQLFGVFRRLHSQKQFEGTGVGLALVRRIVTAHGGRVWAEAEVDKGASFYFALPA